MWCSRSKNELLGHFYYLSSFSLGWMWLTWLCSSGLGHSVKASSVESLQELITSDSEGSYMGAGSPRDLQSPVFHDRPDAQVKPQHLHDINSQTTHTFHSVSDRTSHYLKGSFQFHLLLKTTDMVSYFQKCVTFYILTYYFNLIYNILYFYIFMYWPLVKCKDILVKLL